MVEYARERFLKYNTKPALANMMTTLEAAATGTTGKGSGSVVGSGLGVGESAGVWIVLKLTVIDFPVIGKAFGVL